MIVELMGEPASHPSRPSPKERERERVSSETRAFIFFCSPADRLSPRWFARAENDHTLRVNILESGDLYISGEKGA
jgi:hypothetical protein